MLLRRLASRADRVDAVFVRLRSRLGCKMRLTVELEDLTQMLYDDTGRHLLSIMPASDMASVSLQVRLSTST